MRTDTDGFRKWYLIGSAEGPQDGPSGREKQWQKEEEEEEEELDDSADQMSVASDMSILASELGKPPPLAV
jgi:hypothetical protein